MISPSDDGLFRVYQTIYHPHGHVYNNAHHHEECRTGALHPQPVKVVVLCFEKMEECSCSIGSLYVGRCIYNIKFIHVILLGKLVIIIIRIIRMFELLRTHLQTKSIVLASASPRRRELLSQIGVQFKVIPSTFEENLSKEKSAQQYAELTALHKARQVYSSLCLDAQEIPDIVIGADTVVEHEGIILEKPDDAVHAKEMLQGLSGSKHRVHTGVAIIQSDREVSFCETTTVSFMKFSDADIDEYIASGEPFGKAGAYGIQGKAAVFVESIQGCFYNGTRTLC